MLTNGFTTCQSECCVLSIALGRYLPRIFAIFIDLGLSLRKFINDRYSPFTPLVRSKKPNNPVFYELCAFGFIAENEMLLVKAASPLIILLA